MKSIAIFASGSGTNAQNIIEYFKDSASIKVCRIYANKPDAFVLTRAINFNIQTFIFNRDDFLHSDKIVDQLQKDKTDLIVLAGFLWLIPANILTLFNKRIINIHPALLPKYGGKGMYGMKVHESVLKAGEIESGITIHYVNEKYDEGEIIFQTRCKIDLKDTPDSLAKRIHNLEYKHYPEIIEKVLKDQSDF
jgi:phosphoribosylglycinamide formyltransferase-1